MLIRMKWLWIICGLLALAGEVSALDTVGFADDGAFNNAEIFPDDGFADTVRLYTAVANDVLDSVSIWTRSTSGTSTIVLSLYDVSSGVDGGTLVSSTAPISVSDNTSSWRRVDVNVALTAGKEYMLMACDNAGAGNMVLNGEGGGPSRGIVEADPSCPATLGTLGDTTVRILVWGLIRNSGGGEPAQSRRRRIILGKIKKIEKDHPTGVPRCISKSSFALPYCLP